MLIKGSIIATTLRSWLVKFSDDVALAKIDKESTESLKLVPEANIRFQMVLLLDE